MAERHSQHPRTPTPTHTNLQSLPQINDGCFDSVLLYLHCSHYLVLLCNLRGLELLTQSTYSLLASQRLLVGEERKEGGSQLTVTHLK